MKLGKLGLIYVAVLVTAVLGAGVVMVLSQKPVGAGIKFLPKYYDWDATPVDPWLAQIGLKGGHKAQTEIVAESVRLVDAFGTEYPLSGAPSNATHGPKAFLPFDGMDVKAAIGTHLPHMEPGSRFRIALLIRGTLVGGEEFAGEGTIVVTIPEPPPP